MKVHVGILGDPAKIELYEPDFYHILNWDESRSSFHLLGASENDVTRKDYKAMFNRLVETIKEDEFKPISGLSRPNDYTCQSRIGLFPSSTSHLIKGPSFSFAPFPVNSTSRYLKFKSKFLQFLLRPFVPFKIRQLAYLPLGGKAASKTQADFELSLNDLPSVFSSLRENNNFDWYYLEAGSGQNFLNYELISSVLQAQYNILQPDTKLEDHYQADTRVIIPRFIYGGGIKSVEHIRTLLLPEKGRVKLVPEIIVIGNLSEDNVSKTYKLVEEIGALNEIETSRLY